MSAPDSRLWATQIAPHAESYAAAIRADQGAAETLMDRANLSTHAYNYINDAVDERLAAGWSMDRIINTPINTLTAGVPGRLNLSALDRSTVTQFIEARADYRQERAEFRSIIAQTNVAYEGHEGRDTTEAVDIFTSNILRGESVRDSLLPAVDKVDGRWGVLHDYIRDNPWGSISSGTPEPEQPQRADLDGAEVNQRIVAGTAAGDAVVQQNREAALRRLAEINEQWGLNTGDDIMAVEAADAEQDRYNEETGVGEGVAGLQERLMAVGGDCGLPNYGADGVIRPETNHALENYIRQHGSAFEPPLSLENRADAMTRMMAHEGPLPGTPATGRSQEGIPDRATGSEQPQPDRGTGTDQPDPQPERETRTDTPEPDTTDRLDAIRDIMRYAVINAHYERVGFPPAGPEQDRFVEIRNAAENAFGDLGMDDRAINRLELRTMRMVDAIEGTEPLTNEQLDTVAEQSFESVVGGQIDVTVQGIDNTTLQSYTASVSDALPDLYIPTSRDNPYGTGMTVNLQDPAALIAAFEEKMGAGSVELIGRYNNQMANGTMENGSGHITISENGIDIENSGSAVRDQLAGLDVNGDNTLTREEIITGLDTRTADGRVDAFEQASAENQYGQDLGELLGNLSAPSTPNVGGAGVGAGMGR